MAYIKVDHSKFEPTAASIDSYVSLMKSKMSSADSEISALGADWQGTDYNSFKTQWETVTNEDSTYRKMVSALESYAGYLRTSAKKYKEAQTNAYNRANNLPRW